MTTQGWLNADDFTLSRLAWMKDFDAWTQRAHAEMYAGEILERDIAWDTLAPYTSVHPTALECNHHPYLRLVLAVIDSKAYAVRLCEVCYAVWQQRAHGADQAALERLKLL